MINKNFWKKKRVLLTGFNGFKGSWMTLILNKLGAKVYGYSLNHRKEKLNNNILRLEKNCEKFEYGNILNKQKLFNFFSRIKPDLIIHMASKSTVIESYENPSTTFKTNTIGLINVLSLIKNSKIPAFILTSDKCYKNDEKKNIFSETDPLSGDDPYSASKACQEIICNSFKKSFNLKIATARAGNVIGGCDFTKDRIITDLIDSMFRKKELLLRNPNATRPWQHVLDLNINYLMFVQKFYYNKKLSGAWNFGPQKSYTVKKIIKYFYNKKKFKFKVKKSKFKEKKYLSLSDKKLKKLNIKNNFSINKSLALTYSWYEQYFNNKNNIYNFSIEQIDNAINQK
tara:strand:- start:1349 stop:2374 length:1026 start_codon:yes stop_codon:yes gene_type:complete